MLEHYFKVAIRFIALSLITGHLALFSCNTRNPNLSEKKLLALANDTTRKVAETPATIFPDTSYVPPVGAMFTEIRSVDPASPPVTLKVSIPEGTKQPLRLSMFGSAVEYVTLQLPDEKDFFSSAPSPGLGTFFIRGGVTHHRSMMQVKMLGDHFVVSDALGVRLFDPSGKFVQNLLMSEFESGEQSPQRVTFGGFNEYKQAILSDISGTRCILTFVDYEGVNNRSVFIRNWGYGQVKVWAGEFDLSKRPLNTPQNELSSLTPGVEMVPVRNVPQGLLLDDNTRFSFQLHGNPVAISFNNMGDTLCKFTNYVEGIGGGSIDDRAFFYRADNKLFFRQMFSDTIFRVQSANRIVPAYRLDFGAKLLTPSESASGRTQGKLMAWSWLVFKNSMLLIFSEGRDCPACRTRGEVTFHCLLFDKQTGRSTAIDMKSQYPENILIENDIDGGIPILLNSLHTEGDVMMATFTKFQIEEILNNNAKNIPAETVSKLKALADALKQNEMLLMKIMN